MLGVGVPVNRGKAGVMVGCFAEKKEKKKMVMVESWGDGRKVVRKFVLMLLCTPSRKPKSIIVIG